MRFFRPPWIWLLRIGQRRGYGIHSPFAFAFVRGVVLEEWPYYAYAALARRHPWWVRLLRLRALTCRQLLFRLANYVHPAAFCLRGELALERAYIATAVPSAHEVAAAPADFILLAPSHCNEALTWAAHMPPNGMLVVEGIHANAAAAEAWHRLQADPHTGITFDLYTYGVAFFDCTRHKQHYLINY